MRHVRVTALALFVVLWAGPAPAEYTPREIEEGVARCEKSPPGPQVEVNACAGLQAAKAEQRLTRAYTGLRALLKRFGEPGDAEHLLKVQRAWIAFREASCESRDRGTMVSMVQSGCIGEMADDRAKDLEAWLAEECDRNCVTGTEIKECRACGT